MGAPQQVLISYAVAAAGGNGYYRSITVDKTKVPNTDQTDFPVLVTGTYSYLATVANGGKVQNASGYDIGFYSDSALTTKLKWEIVGWDATTGKVIYWVKIPTLTTATNYVFYIAYGNTTITTDQSDRANTWNTAFKGIVHFGDGTTIDIADKSSYAVGGTNHGVTATTGAFEGGTLGGAGSFSSDYVDYGNNWGETGDLTINFWENGSNFTAILDKSNNVTGVAGPIGFPFSGAFNQGRMTVGNGTVESNHDIRTANTPPSGTWTYWSWKITGTTFYIRKNGSQDNTGSFTVAARTNQAGYSMFMGANNASSEFYAGKLAEVRISDVLRSDDWDNTCYNNQSSPSTFYTLGSEVAA